MPEKSVGRGTLKRLEEQENIKTQGTDITILQRASRKSTLNKAFVLPKVRLHRKRADRV